MIQNDVTGNLLIASPAMSDPRFSRSVIYVCAHNPEGSMGIMINRLFEDISYLDLLLQLGIEGKGKPISLPVHFGGPVESGRGFVLHSNDYMLDSTLEVDETFSLTATIDILQDIADGDGPKRHLLALGYAGWGPGQLDEELQSDGWLFSKANEELLFDIEVASRWEAALAMIGAGDLSALSGQSGHA